MMFKVGCRGGHGVWDDQMLRYRDNEEGDDEGRTREGNFRVNTPQAPPQFRHQSPRNHPFLSIFFLSFVVICIRSIRTCYIQNINLPN